MSKPIKAQVKLQLMAGAATPAPPVGSTLGPHQVNLMEFCKQFNAKTADKKGEVVPVVVTVYTDKTFEFITKTPPSSGLIKKAVKISKGAVNPGSQVVAKITWDAIEAIAKIKMEDLNAVDLETAKKVIAGTARSMGIEVV